jgi:periplasmic protein TonB
MFDVLIASAAHREVRAGSVTTSMITHALLIMLAVTITRAALENPPVPSVDPAILLFVPKPPPPPEPEVKVEPPAITPLVAEPAPKGFQTVVAPRDIPDVIPPVDLTQRPLDPRDFTGRGVEGGVAGGVVGGTGTASPDGASDLGAIYEATTRDDRFEQAAVVFQPVPRYPTALAAAGIEGKVAMEFIIDTAGKVEGGSIRVLESSHQTFEAAAREAMKAAVFRPARLSNHPVRQLTRQSIRFVATH